MGKAISGVVFIHAKRVNITRYPHVGDHGGAMKLLQSAREHADFELLKNTINIDKYPKRFMGRTNDIIHYNIV